MNYKIECTIPVTAYGNIRPTFEVEDSAQEIIALEKMKELWDKYGEKPLPEKESGGLKMETFTGETIMYNDNTHKYTDMSGNTLLSGSVYADSVSPKFNLEFILGKTSKSWEVSEEALGEVWSMKGDVATSYGTSIHNALDLYHKHHEIGEKISKDKGEEDNYVLPNNKHIREVVQSFVSEFGADALSEVLVSDVSNGRAGQIDRLQILDEKKKLCRVGDYKFVDDLDKKKMLKYQHQLSFYSHILINAGWKVEGIDLFQYNGEWTKHELQVLDLQNV